MTSDAFRDAVDRKVHGILVSLPARYFVVKV